MTAMPRSSEGRKPLVELIYFNAGGGHRASSLALESAIQRAGLPWQVQRTNLFEVLDPGARFRQWTGMDPEDVYNRRLARGWTLGLSQELRVLQSMIRFSHRALVQRLRGYWASERPDMVVSLVPNFNRSMADALALTLPEVPFVTVMTDLADCPPRFWMEPRTQQHVVCGTPFAVAQARAAGCAAHRVWQSGGMLLGEQFYRPTPVHRVQELQRAGLDPTQPTGLVLFGAEGSRQMEAIAQALTDTQLIVACGRNAPLARAMRALPRNAPTLVLEFTREMARYMQMADFFIGKPGSGSLSEAVQMGLAPIVVRNAWTMPQERYCTDWVRDNGLGLVLPSFKDVAAAVQELTPQLPRFKDAAQRVRNSAAQDVPVLLERILRDATRRSSARNVLLAA